MRGKIAIVLVLGLAGCSSPRVDDTALAPAATVRASPTASPSPPGSPPPSPSPVADVAELLPRELDGVALHTFAVARDLVGRLAAAVGVPVDELEMAYASEHGVRFIQMLAIRSPTVAPGEMLDALGEVAYPPGGAAQSEVGTDRLAGLDVVVVNDSELDVRFGTFYGLVRGGALIVVEAFERDAAEAALNALP